MSARDGDPLVGGQDPRPYAAARRDLIAQPRVKIGKTADRADGRDAAHQLCPGKAADHLIGDLPRQRRGEDRADQLFVVPLLFLRLAAACKMDMHVDQARHQIPALQVDDGIAVKRRPLRDDGADALSVRQDAESFLHLHVLRAVQELSVCECVFHRISLTFLLYSIACCADPVKPQRAESAQKTAARKKTGAVDPENRLTGGRGGTMIEPDRAASAAARIILRSKGELFEADHLYIGACGLTGRSGKSHTPRLPKLYDSIFRRIHHESGKQTQNVRKRLL